MLETHWHQGIQQLCRDLNQQYRQHPALHDLYFESSGFTWVDCDNADQSILSFVRRSRSGAQLVVVLNFTPVPRTGHRLGVPKEGPYRELINSD